MNPLEPGNVGGSNVKMPYVVLADDEHWYVEPICDALEFSGMEVKKCRTGSDTLAMLTPGMRLPNILILDIMMDPGSLECADDGTRTGIHVLREIRERLGLLNLTVICLTVIEDEEVRSEAMKLGVSNFLVKRSVRVSDIVSLVRSLI